MSNTSDKIGAALVAGALGAMLYFAPDHEAIARNQFIGFARTEEGKRGLMVTLQKLKALSNINMQQIGNLERTLANATTTTIDGPTQCPFMYPLCLDNVGDIFDEYSSGERSI